MHTKLLNVLVDIDQWLHAKRTLQVETNETIFQLKRFFPVTLISTLLSVFDCINKEIEYYLPERTFKIFMKEPL